ncbi:MAG: hypothetical protein NTZ25_02060 [Candidatus Peregrinibacteria bacterium]|nr:hypothetical protein [Candidatus Peregrinibacteria bacterium]
MEDPKDDELEVAEQDNPKKRAIIERLSAIGGISKVSEMETGVTTADQKSQKELAPKTLPFSRIEASRIDLNTNPNAEIICNFGKLGERPVHVLVAIAYAYANGVLTEAEATSLHFEALHALVSQFADSPRKNLLEARLLRVEALARAIKSMRKSLRLGETSKLEDYHVDSILGSTESLKAADALDPAPTRVSDERVRTRRLVIASGIAGLAMGIGAALGATYPEKVHKAGSSVEAAIKTTTDWVSKKWEEIK